MNKIKISVIVFLLLVLIMAVLGCGGGSSSSSTPTFGKLQGTIKDSQGNPLVNVSVSISGRANGITPVTTDNNGDYFFTRIPVGTGYQLSYTLDGYSNITYFNIDITDNQTTYLEPVTLLTTTQSTGTGIVSGKIIDGTVQGGTAGVPGATVNLRTGVNANSGLPVQTTTSDSSGNYTFSGLAAGIYTGEVIKTSWATTYFTVICIGGTTKSNQDVTMTPAISGGQTRIILTWGESPSDLDSHLTGPLPDGTRFHLYFIYAPTWGGVSPWPDYVKLDVDDTTSYGPETTTIYQQLPGVYRFSVHDYSNSGSTPSNPSSGLANSSAQVKIYRGNNLVKVFNVPTGKDGNLWTVFEMNGDTITPINTISYIDDYETIQSLMSHSDANLLKNIPPKSK